MSCCSGSTRTVYKSKRPYVIVQTMKLVFPNHLLIINLSLSESDRKVLNKILNTVPHSSNYEILNYWNANNHIYFSRVLRIYSNLTESHTILRDHLKLKGLNDSCVIEISEFDLYLLNSLFVKYL